MLKRNVKIGAHYAMRHHNERNLTVVRIESESIYGGYNARKLKTGRTIRVKSAAKLRYEVQINPQYGIVMGARKWAPVTGGALASRDMYLPAPVVKTEAKYDCECGGSGKYHGHGSVVNGKFVGFVGTCFRCQGKGWQNVKDRKRNLYYDNHVRRIAV
jgi:hypothetical protein